MRRTDPVRLAKYVEAIARKHGGLQGLIARLRQIAKEREDQERLETVGAMPPPADAEDVDAARKAVETIDSGRELSPEQMDQLEAIIDADLRPAIDIEAGTFVSSHPLWSHLSTDAAISGRLQGALASIGRIELPGHPRLPYGGTGFVVGRGLVMTNRHVAEIFSSGVGNRNIGFRPGGGAGIDFRRERDNAAGQVFMVRDVAMVHPYWDMALLEVEGLDSRNPLKLSLEDARDMEGHDIAVIGYPAFDPRNTVADMQHVYEGRFGVKRLQPGELRGGASTGSFGKAVLAATHDSSTLGGCSGAAVIDLATGAVLGLHFGGRHRDRNYAVPSSELSRDGRVIQAGVEFDGIPAPGMTDWAGWWARADAGESPSFRGEEDDGAAVALGDGSAAVHAPPAAATAGAGAVSAIATATATGGTLRLEIPLVVTVTLGDVARLQTPVSRPAGGDPAGGESLEAMVEPYRDQRYAGRVGYDPLFLADQARTDSTRGGAGLRSDARLSVPMPTAKDPAVLALTKEGKDILHYQNFSIRMHRTRRLALVTASNVTAEPRLRRPEAGRDYTRAGLAGLGKNDVEQWFQDPRLDAAYQLPDVFFTKDRKAFDKGHIVRRDDVAWGRSYAALRRANGDTYHVTNCSPQVASYNQSAKGEVNWGDLENQVLASAKTERLCVFAGPVLRRNDRVFHGVGVGGTALRARIPGSFWKVIVSRVDDGIAAYGFVLDQDLSDVEFEYVPTEEFVPKMVPVADIAERTGVEFDEVIVAADQYDSTSGVELAFFAGLDRAA